MKNSYFESFVVAALVGTTGCELHARSPEDYRKDTRALLETRSAEIQRCYDGVLAHDPNASGTVVVAFTVTEESGAIAHPRAKLESTAPAALCECVVKAVDGLSLRPPDPRKGDATFAWEFTRS